MGGMALISWAIVLATCMSEVKKDGCKDLVKKSFTWFKKKGDVQAHGGAQGRKNELFMAVIFRKEDREKTIRGIVSDSSQKKRGSRAKANNNDHWRNPSAGGRPVKATRPQTSEKRVNVLLVESGEGWGEKEKELHVGNVVGGKKEPRLVTAAPHLRLGRGWERRGGTVLWWVQLDLYKKIGRVARSGAYLAGKGVETKQKSFTTVPYKKGVGIPARMGRKKIR